MLFQVCAMAREHKPQFDGQFLRSFEIDNCFIRADFPLTNKTMLMKIHLLFTSQRVVEKHRVETSPLLLFIRFDQAVHAYSAFSREFRSYFYLPKAIAVVSNMLITLYESHNLGNRQQRSGYGTALPIQRYRVRIPIDVFFILFLFLVV